MVCIIVCQVTIDKRIKACQVILTTTNEGVVCKSSLQTTDAEVVVWEPAKCEAFLVKIPSYSCGQWKYWAMADYKPVAIVTHVH